MGNSVVVHSAAIQQVQVEVSVLFTSVKLSQKSQLAMPSQPAAQQFAMRTHAVTQAWSACSVQLHAEWRVAEGGGMKMGAYNNGRSTRDRGGMGDGAGGGNCGGGGGGGGGGGAAAAAAA